MDFDRKTDDGRDYAQLFPTMNGDAGNRALRATASDAGNKDMVAFVKAADKEPEWRLYKDQVPAGLDVDKAFGKFVSEDAKAASLAETAAFKERQSMTAGVTKSPRGQEIPAEDRLYPNTALKAEFDREVAARKKDGVEVKYDAAAGAYHVTAGSKEGFDKFKTPEAKAQWESEADLTTAQRKSMAREADRAIDATAERAAGRHFVADNAEGFKLPNPQESRQAEKLHTSQMASLKKATDVDLMRIMARTRDAGTELADKQTQIRLNKALDLHADKGLTPKEFYEEGRLRQGADGKWESRYAGDNRQRALAGGAGLGPTEFGKLVALERGYSAVKKEATARGLLAERSRGRGQSNEQQQGQAQEQGQSQSQERQQEQGQRQTPPVQDKAMENAGAAAGAGASETPARGTARARGNWQNALARGAANGMGG